MSDDELDTTVASPAMPSSQRIYDTNPDDMTVGDGFLVLFEGERENEPSAGKINVIILFLLLLYNTRSLLQSKMSN